jgi:tetratricopeptide (TPR) repeat protein
MASISLRSYNREIETLIDQGQTEEALSHCIHILQSVPKHIATYRLLGKALLEMQRYSDALDIFQRVLSSVPDDFVSHVGMSIIRENEKNLDGAIWHMERAFEAQPSNAAIQDELRRLYGRRDGMEPPKIRLTRGALARMYAKGHLYAQAIGELQAALAEDAQRPDLQVLLASMYHRSGQREQAIKTSSDLLKKLPHCLEANRILADILPGGASGTDTQSYYQRLISLDPYYGKIDPRSPTSDHVADNSIVIERLNYQPGQKLLGAESQPAWSTSLGTPFQSSQAEPSLSDWSFDQKTSDEGGLKEEGTPSTEDLPDSEMDWGSVPTPVGQQAGGSEDLIPDFLKDAGWEKTDRTADEIAMEELQKEQEALTEDIAPAEIPEWLREIAPEGALEPSEQLEENEVLPWLQESEPGPTDSVITWLEDTKPPASEEQLGDLAEALKAASITGSEPLPDWVSGEETEEPTTELQADLPISESPLEGELPDWLQGAEMESTQPGEGEPLPDWMVEELASDENAPVSELPVSEIGSETEAQVAETVEPELIEPVFTEEVEQEAVSAELSSDEAEWLPGEVEKTPVEALIPATPAEFEEALPDFLAEEEPEEVEAVEALPEWMQALAEETPAAETSLEQPAELPPLEQAVTGEALPAGEFNLDDADAALAWLESLAMQQGVNEEQLTTRPEDRPETPDWLISSALEAEARGEVPVYEPTETVEGLVPAVEEPVEELIQAEAEEAVAEATEAEAELPDWLKGPEAEVVAEEAVPEAPEVEAEVEVEPAAEFEETVIWQEPAAIEAGAELPDWLNEPEAEAVSEEATPEIPVGESVAEEEWVIEAPILEEAKASTEEGNSCLVDGRGYRNGSRRNSRDSWGSRNTRDPWMDRSTRSR